MIRISLSGAWLQTRGTATFFSDTRQRIAAEYDFWLGEPLCSAARRVTDHQNNGHYRQGAWHTFSGELASHVQTIVFTVGSVSANSAGGCVRQRAC